MLSRSCRGSENESRSSHWSEVKLRSNLESPHWSAVKLKSNLEVSGCFGWLNLSVPILRNLEGGKGAA